MSDIPSVEDSADEADELQREVERVLEGHPHEQVISVCASLLGQAVASISETPDQASDALLRYANLIADDVCLNWHLVVARRRRQRCS